MVVDTSATISLVDGGGAVERECGAVHGWGGTVKGSLEDDGGRGSLEIGLEIDGGRGSLEIGLEIGLEMARDCSRCARSLDGTRTASDDEGGIASSGIASCGTN